MKSIKRYLGILLFALSLVLSVSLVVPEINGCVDVQAATVSLSKTSTSVYVGKTTQLKVNNYTKTVKWSSSNTSIATVSSTGKVKGKKVGTVTISVKAGTRILKCKVTVRSFISASPKTLYLDGVDDGAIYVKVKRNCELNYSVSNSGIVSCSWDDGWYNNGTVTYLYVTGKKNGTTYITISNKYNNEKVKIKVVVDIEDDNGDDYSNSQLVMSAIGIQKAYDSAKFPSSLHIRSISYEENLVTGYGDNVSRLVVHAYAKNSIGGYGDIYSVVIQSKTNTHYSDAFKYEGYYYTTSAYSKNPGMDGVSVNNRDAVNMWKQLYDKNFEIPYD